LEISVGIFMEFGVDVVTQVTAAKSYTSNPAIGNTSEKVA
jgi:hypothetical protein